MKKLIMFAALSILLTFFTSQASAQLRQRVRFAAGTHSATVTGTVRGYAYRDYVVNARAGQTIDVKLTSANDFAVFTVFLPNGDNLEGAMESNKFSGELPSNGNYKIRVMMMRAEARRRGSIANYKLRISIR
jgi:hypothetical protein